MFNYDLETNILEEQSKIGSFRVDIPNCILKASVLNSFTRELNCCVDWRERQNGSKPEPSWISSEVLIEKSPGVLCEFLMKHIKFPNNNGSLSTNSQTIQNNPEQEQEPKKD